MAKSIANTMMHSIAANLQRALWDALKDEACGSSPSALIKKSMAEGAAHGGIEGALGGAAAFGIPTDGLGVVPGAAIGGFIGASVGAGGGALSGIERSGLCSLLGAYGG